MTSKYEKLKADETLGISIKCLSKQYGEKTLFRDFSLNFLPKGLYAISGKSGIGKTTLLRMICGLDKNFSGEIKIFGKVAFVFQEYRLFDSLTALENITEVLYEKATDINIDAAKRLLGHLGFTTEEMLLYPHELSGGMKQRVSIARAFLSDANILLLDEATKELDAELCDIVLELIKDAALNRLVIIVTHKSEEIERLSATEVNL